LSTNNCRNGLSDKAGSRREAQDISEKIAQVNSENDSVDGSDFRFHSTMSQREMAISRCGMDLVSHLNEGVRKECPYEEREQLRTSSGIFSSS
jgi:hypothetical protein